jgi:hypothetical protein
MRQILHGCAARQRVVRHAIQQSPESLNQLADHQPTHEGNVLGIPDESET